MHGRELNCHKKELHLWRRINRRRSWVIEKEITCSNWLKYQKMRLKKMWWAYYSVRMFTSCTSFFFLLSVFLLFQNNAMNLLWIYILTETYLIVKKKACLSPGLAMNVIWAYYIVWDLKKADCWQINRTFVKLKAVFPSPFSLITWWTSTKI